MPYSSSYRGPLAVPKHEVVFPPGYENPTDLHGALVAVHKLLSEPGRWGRASDFRRLTEPQVKKENPYEDPEDGVGWCCCLRGGMSAVILGRVTWRRLGHWCARPLRFATEPEQHLWAQVYDYMDRLVQQSIWPHDSMVSFNDAPGRKLEDILALLETGIERTAPK